jgi:hypothetical protein
MNVPAIRRVPCFRGSRAAILSVQYHRESMRSTTRIVAKLNHLGYHVWTEEKTKLPIVHMLSRLPRCHFVRAKSPRKHAKLHTHCSEAEPSRLPCLDGGENQDPDSSHAFAVVLHRRLDCKRAAKAWHSAHSLRLVPIPLTGQRIAKQPAYHEKSRGPKLVRGRHKSVPGWDMGYSVSVAPTVARIVALTVARFRGVIESAQQSILDRSPDINKRYESAR